MLIDNLLLFLKSQSFHHNGFDLAVHIKSVAVLDAKNNKTTKFCQQREKNTKYTHIHAKFTTNDPFFFFPNRYLLM